MIKTALGRPFPTENSAGPAGWPWAAMLLCFFLTSTGLSAAGAERKRRTAGSRIAKAGARDALQVIANGGVFAVGAIAWAASRQPAAAAAAIGALASATGDTWATEAGLLASDAPRSVVTWRRVPPGTSGGVSLFGVGAGIAGAVWIAAAARALGVVPGSFLAMAVGGTAGLLADSLLGATLQSQRYCDRCREDTERAVHTCGSPTRHARGARWLTNDGVNAIATAVGAITAGVWYSWSGSA